MEKRYNRVEDHGKHSYFEELGGHEFDFQYNGIVKCKLMHGEGNSIYVPDQIYLERKGKWGWIQPLAFHPHVVFRFSDYITVQLFIDISCRQTIRLKFKNHDLLRNHPDCSQTYSCEISGPKELFDYTTEEAFFSTDNRPYIRLYHHTSTAAREAILRSKHFKTGSCNFQGTTRRLKNVGYVYFTPIDRLLDNTDLNAIAMSNKGEILLLKDGVNLPGRLTADWVKQNSQNILRYPVYTPDLSKKESTVGVWVDAATLAPMHLHRHEGSNAAFYALALPFVQRIGTQPGGRVSFDNDMCVHYSPELRAFEYIVVGDCTTLDGLSAPYEEEDTKQIMKIECVPEGVCLLDFWFSEGNRDHFRHRHLEFQELTDEREL